MTICERTREELAGYRDGILDRRARVRVESHLATCRHCSAELRRDERLVRLLEHLPAEAPPAATWAQVHAERRARDARPLHLAPRRLIAGLAAAAAATLILAGSYRAISGRLLDTPSRTVSVAISDESPWEQAHLVTGFADFGADPNRSIVLTHAARPAPGDQP